MIELTVDYFRSVFPEFSDENAYSDAAIQYRINLAEKFFGESPFCDELTLQHAQCLYTAHFLSVQGGSSALTKGAIGGIVSGKSVDGASVSYDTASSIERDAGFWNATGYGRELWQLMQMFGAGGLQL